MPFNPLAEHGLPLELPLRSWSELNVEPYSAFWRILTISTATPI